MQQQISGNLVVCTDFKTTKVINMQKNIKKNAGDLPENVIEFEGEQYQWQNKSFRLQGDPRFYTSEDALVDLGLLKRLLSIPGQSILKKLH